MTMNNRPMTFGGVPPLVNHNVSGLENTTALENPVLKIQNVRPNTGNHL